MSTVFARSYLRGGPAKPSGAAGRQGCADLPASGAAAQLIDQFAARRKAVFGFLARARAMTGRSSGGNGASLGLLRWCCMNELCGVPSGERQDAREQFLEDDGQAVLIAVQAGVAREHFWRGVDGGQAADQRYGGVLDVFYQSEIGDLHAAAENQKVLRLDVEVLERESLPHVIQGIGRIAQVDEQLVAGNSRGPCRHALLEAIHQARVGQLGDDDQLPVDDLDAFQGEEEGMADFLDAAEGLEFAAGPFPSRQP